MKIESVFQKAAKLRTKRKFQESRSVLEPLLTNESFSARAHLYIAWSYDNEGNELGAVSHYEEALLGNLKKEERFEALFGIACTLRSLGRYEDSFSYFEMTLSEFPEAIEVKPFYAMCLYNLGRSKTSTKILLNLLLEVTESESILKYGRAISQYAEDLDRKW